MCSSKRRAWAAVACVAGVWLSGSRGAAQTRPADAAATFGDRVLTVRELDDDWKRFDAATQAQAEQSLYDGRKAAFDRIVAGALIDRAAAVKGLTTEKFLEEEAARRRKPVTDAEVEAFYTANKSQMEGAALSAVKDSIRDFLSQRQDATARAALVADLRKAGPVARLAIEPPRLTVAVTPQNPARGPATALVTVVEYSDYQCPFCGRVTPTLKRLRDTYGERLRIVWKDFPLVAIHPLAEKASEAAYCAGEQNKYWEFHDRLFANQSALAVDALKQHAAAMGIEPVGFGACLDSGRYADRVHAGMDEGKGFGVDSTPTLFINGRRVTGAQPYEVFEGIIEDELARAAGK